MLLELTTPFLCFSVLSPVLFKLKHLVLKGRVLGEKFSKF